MSFDCILHTLRTLCAFIDHCMSVKTRYVHAVLTFIRMSVFVVVPERVQSFDCNILRYNAIAIIILPF